LLYESVAGPQRTGRRSGTSVKYLDLTGSYATFVHCRIYTGTLSSGSLRTTSNSPTCSQGSSMIESEYIARDTD
jgi:hypothetical protein